MPSEAFCTLPVIPRDLACLTVKDLGRVSIQVLAADLPAVRYLKLTPYHIISSRSVMEHKEIYLNFTCTNQRRFN